MEIQQALFLKHMILAPSFMLSTILAWITPLRTLAAAFCVYSLGIGPENIRETKFIKIFHQGIPPHLASMVTVQKLLSMHMKD